MSQPIALVLHGGLLAASCMDLELSPILRAHRVMHRVTRPGYPGSTISGIDFVRGISSPDDVMSALVSHTLGAINAVEADAVDIVAYSLGAAVAVATALEAPHRVRSLVLLDPPLINLVPSGATLADQLRALSQLLNSMAPDALAVALIDGSTAQGMVHRRPELLGGVNDMNVTSALTQSLDAFLHVDVPAVLAWSVPPAQLAKLRMPISIVSGAQSDEVYTQSVALLREVVPHAHVTCIPEANHALQLVWLEPVIQAIADTVFHNVASTG